MINGLPQKIKALRVKYGLSQKQVAARLGVSPSIVSGYETGERTPSTEVLLSLAYLYQCSTDYLLGKNQDVSPSIRLDGLSNDQVKAIRALVDSIKLQFYPLSKPSNYEGFGSLIFAAAGADPASTNRGRRYFYISILQKAPNPLQPAVFRCTNYCTNTIKNHVCILIARNYLIGSVFVGFEPAGFFR